MQNEVVKLIKQTYTLNDVGDAIAAETEREVFAKRESIGLKRKLEAEEAGLKLAYKFTLADEYDYDNEEILEYNEERFNIVNVFITSTREVELTTARF